MRPFRFAFNHLSWGRFGQHRDSWGRFGEAVSACPSFSGAVMGWGRSVKAVSGGAVLVMIYFGAVWVEAVSEWGRFDQLPTWKQTMISGNSGARSCAGEEDGVKWLFGLVNSTYFYTPSLDRTYYEIMVWRCASVRPFVRLLERKTIDAIGRVFFKFGTQVCLGVPLINFLFFVLS